MIALLIILTQITRSQYKKKQNSNIKSTGYIIGDYKIIQPLSS